LSLSSSYSSCKHYKLPISSYSHTINAFEYKLTSARKPVQSEPPPQLNATTAFYIFALANVVAAIFSPIQDCDEVFNYWEPSHYLNHGYGLQTWEYSPEYAIRSWTYTGIHSLAIWIGTLPLRALGYGNSKVAAFYFLRTTLAIVCALCQARLFSVISRTFNPRVAVFFMIAMVISPGMYHAAPAYLPSTFAMYTTMLGFSAFMDWSGGFIRTAQGITWFGIGTVLGWPFAGALVLPFIFEEAILAFATGETFESFWRLLQGSARSLVVLAIQIAIDSFFYKKLVCVPLNIVLYNVFSGGSRGPDIYGVEPWHFYIRNLTLNFNIWFFLALAAFPLLLVQHLGFRKSVSKQTLIRSVVFVSPFYLWLAIFTVQPHKEERFMYPAYPALAINAAISLHILLANFGSTDPRHLVSKIPPQLKLAMVTIPLLLSFNVGMLRTLGTLTAYSAPLSIYKPLHESGVAHAGDNVCLGKEWYRFPSSFHLPHGVRAKFIKSEFTGLLPGEFSDAKVGFGLFPGTWLVPPGMNDENVEDPGKYTEIEHCNFLVDSRLPGSPSTTLEPDYIADQQHWETLKCVTFLDTSQTHILGRLFWIPDLPFIPERFRRKWGDYCLLQQRDTKSAHV
jgi:alpha-1,2-mannosyltransferase